jgi:hypothetical protein
MKTRISGPPRSRAGSLTTAGAAPQSPEADLIKIAGIATPSTARTGRRGIPADPDVLVENGGN